MPLNIDSLKRQLQLAKNDTSRCAQLSLLVKYDTLTDWQEYNSMILKICERKFKDHSVIGSEQRALKFYYIGALNNEGYEANIQGKVQEAVNAYGKCLSLSKDIGDKLGQALALNNLGYVYKDRGENLKAIKAFMESLEILEELNDKNGIALTYNNLGFIFSKQGNVKDAIVYYERSRKIYESIEDKEGIALASNNLAAIYKDQGDLEEALSLYKKSLKIREEIGDHTGMAGSLVNIGAVYRKKGDYSSSLAYYEKGLAVAKSANLRQLESYALHNIAGLLRVDHKFERAKDLYFEALKIQTEVGDKRGMAATLQNIGELYLAEESLAKALTYTKDGMRIATEIGYPVEIRNAALQLKRIYEKSGDYQDALKSYELFVKMKDSLDNEANRKTVVRSQLKYEYEKQAAADSVAHAKETEIKNAELKKQEAEIKAKKNQQVALFGGLCLVLVFAGFMFNRWKVTQQQKVIIELQKTEVEEQKKLVEEKQNEILASIKYAQRIQNAQLPHESFITRNLKKIKP